jgi:hypothetical protein
MMKVIHIPRAVAALSLLAAFAVAPAFAAPVYPGTYVDMYLSQTTFPNNLSEQMVYLDPAIASTITGHVGSQVGTPLVTFSSTTDSLHASSGFATIRAVDGTLNNVTITAPGYLFDDLIFSLNLMPSATLTITANSLAGTDSSAGWTTLADWVNGSNRILVLSTPGNLMTSVTINSVDGLSWIGAADQLKQTEISGLVPVPETETWAMMLAGLGLVGLQLRRRNAGQHVIHA